MKKSTVKKLAVMLAIMALLTVFFSVNCLAAPPTTTSPQIADVVEDVADDMLVQVKQIVNNVVFPIIDLILVVALGAKAAMLYYDYRQQRQMNWVPLVLLGVGLVWSLTAPLYIWKLIGM